MTHAELKQLAEEGWRFTDPDAAPDARLDWDWGTVRALCQGVLEVVGELERTKRAHNDNLTRWQVSEQRFVTEREAMVIAKLAALIAERDALKKENEKLARMEAELKDYKTRCQAWADSATARNKYIQGVEVERDALQERINDVRADLETALEYAPCSLPHMGDLSPSHARNHAIHFIEQTNAWVEKALSRLDEARKQK